MTKAQRWVFILVTLPVCCIALAVGISSIGDYPSQLDLKLHVGNMWSSKTTYGDYATQEIFDIREAKN